MALLGRYWPYVAIVLGAAAAWGLHTYDRARYGALQTDYATYRAQVAEANLKAEKAAREAVEAQTRERARIDKSNAEALNAYQTRLATISADRDRSRELVRRLLAAGQSRPAGSGGDLPQAGDLARPPEASPAGSHVEIGELLIDASAECRSNAAQLNGLIQEVTPQL